MAPPPTLYTKWIECPIAIVGLNSSQTDLNISLFSPVTGPVFLLTVKTSTSLLLRTSSTRPSGLPLGVGMVPRIAQEELSKVFLTALTNDWLKSSIFPISSMMNTFLLLPSAEPTWKPRDKIAA